MYSDSREADLIGVHMSFVQFKLDKSFNQARGIFDTYVYRPDNGDTKADISTPGYFNDSRYINDPDWENGLIEIEAADGYLLAQISSNLIVSIYDPDKVSTLSPNVIEVNEASDLDDLAINN
jgi:hypothetical protein